MNAPNSYNPPIKKFLGLMLTLAMTQACSTITIQPEYTFKKTPETASHEASMPFYLWGMIGEERVDVNQICGNESKPIQMQTQQTSKDSLFSIGTLGIYTPHTVRVWCE